MKTNEFLAELRQSEGLKSAIVSEIRVSERYKTVEFYIITDRTYSDGDEAYALKIAQKYVPEARVSVKISKLVADESIVSRKIFSCLKEKFPALSSFISEGDISVERTDSGAIFTLEIGEKERALVNSDSVIDTVCSVLKQSFCGSFIGKVKFVEKEEVNIEDDGVIPPPEQALPIRIFPVENYSEIDGGEKPKYAVYIADIVGAENDLVISGEIVDMRERATTAGKPFYVFTLCDCSSAKMRVTYFTKKKSVEKIQKLEIGDKIVCRGDYSEFNGKLSYTAKYINKGGSAEGYIPQEKPRRKAPAVYKTVKPQPYRDFNQTSLYSKEKPACLKNNVFVVYDLETTGLNNTGVGGYIDNIIEVGAVKLIGGEIVEQFSTFVALDRKLSAEIIALTGITDDMLKGAPDISDVIPDFYKFCEGSIMVGHNSIVFDSKFINYYARQCDFEFTNRQCDTLDIANKYLRNLPNQKLNTLADYYGVSFNHHRAFEDAAATAKIFMAMVTEFNVNI